MKFMRTLFVLAYVLCSLPQTASAWDKVSSLQKSTLFTNLDIIKGRAGKFRYAEAFGNNSNVGTTFEDIWGEGGDYPFIDPALGAQDCQIASSSAQDAPSGTGASEVRVRYLDANWELQVEEVTMAGQTPVDLASDCLRVLDLNAVSLGSGATYGATNAGIVRVGYGAFTSGVPATILGRITEDKGGSSLGMYTIPEGEEGAMPRIAITSGKNDDAIVEVMVRENSDGRAWRMIERVLMFQDTVQFELFPKTVLPARTDIRIRAKSSTSNTEISSNMILLLERRQ